MNVKNVHERSIARPAPEVGKLLDSLASRTDRLWPHEKWPPMKLDRAFAVGSKGGHGPIRYSVKSFSPRKNVFFSFTGPRGFNGDHGFEIDDRDDGGSVIRHTLVMNTTGVAVLSWPLIFEPLHNALIEDCFDKAERNFGFTPAEDPWSLWVRVLRWLFRNLQSRKNALRASGRQA